MSVTTQTFMSDDIAILRETIHDLAEVQWFPIDGSKRKLLQYLMRPNEEQWSI